MCAGEGFTPSHYGITILREGINPSPTVKYLKLMASTLLTDSGNIQLTYTLGDKFQAIPESNNLKTF